MTLFTNKSTPISLCFSLLLCLSCFGQPAPINRRAMAISGLAQGPAHALPPGMALRWKASDLAASPVSAWQDEIQGYWWTNSGSARPTWDASGVTFNGSSQFLYTTNVFVDTGSTKVAAWLFVFKFNSTGNGQMVASSFYGGGGIFLGIDSADKFYDGSTGHPVGPVGTSAMDFFTCKNSSDSKFYVYTNGVASQYTAQTTAWNAIATKLIYIGSGAGNGYGSFTLKEVIKWTNYIFSASDIAEVHYYATNTYSYSP